MDEPPTVLITGANRGIGLALAVRYATDGWTVIATCRDPGEARDALAAVAADARDVTLLPLDVRSATSVAALAHAVGDRHIDVLINNAGLNGPSIAQGNAASQEFGTVDYDAWADVLDVNLLGPMRVTQSLIDNVAASNRRIVAVITSALGSNARASGGKYAYRTSKAAANMLVRNLSHDLAPRGVATAAICPGWVRTRMGGDAARSSPEDAARAVQSVLAGIDVTCSGQFWDENGAAIPW